MNYSINTSQSSLEKLGFGGLADGDGGATLVDGRGFLIGLFGIDLSDGSDGPFLAPLKKATT